MEHVREEDKYVAMSPDYLQGSSGKQSLRGKHQESNNVKTNYFICTNIKMSCVNYAVGLISETRKYWPISKPSTAIFLPSYFSKKSS